MNLLKRLWNKGGHREPECLQCGLIPGRQYMVTTADPIMHPHECSWCKSIVYFPGPMFECPSCTPEPRYNPAA